MHPLSAAHRLILIATQLVFFAPVLLSQEQKPSSTQNTQSTGGMGVATGAAHPAVKDAQSRPITAGGFVEKGPIVFLDITKQAGLDKFSHRSGAQKKETILETMGSGVALLDYDNDGWLD